MHVLIFIGEMHLAVQGGATQEATVLHISTCSGKLSIKKKFYMTIYCHG